MNFYLHNNLGNTGIFRRIYSAISFLIIIALLLTGCNSQTQTQNSTEEPAVPATAVVQTTPVEQSPQISSSNSEDSSEPEVEMLPSFDLQLIGLQNARELVPIAVLEDATITSSSISPDGQWIARNTYSGVYVYDISTGENTASLTTNGLVVKSAFSGQSDLLAVLHVSANAGDGVTIRTDASNPYIDKYSVSVWDIQNREVLFTKSLEELCAAHPGLDLFQFLEDDSLVITAVDHSNHVQSVCQIAHDSGTLIDRLDLDTAYGFAHSIAISLDGLTLGAVFSSAPFSIQGPSLVILDFPDGIVLHERQLTVITNLAFIPETHTLVFIGEKSPEELTLEQVSSDGSLLNSFSLPPASTKGLPFSINDQYLAISYSNQSGTFVFDLNTGEQIRKFPVQPKHSMNAFEAYIEPVLAGNSDTIIIHQVCMRDCGRERSSIRVFNLPAGNEEIFTFESPAADSIGDLSPNGSFAAMGGYWNGEFRVWDTANGRLIYILSSHSGPVNQVVFSPDSLHLATASSDGSARLWNLDSGEQERVFSGHEGEILCLDFSPNGNYLITASADNSLRLWDVETGKEIKKFDNPVQERIITRVWFTSDHSVLLNIPRPETECNDCEEITYILDTGTGEFIRQPWNRLDAYRSPDGDWLLHYGDIQNMVINIGKMPDGQFQSERIIPLTHFNDGTEFALSTDGQLIFSLNANGINIIDRSSGEQIDLAANYLSTQSFGSGQMQTSPDGKFLLAFSFGKMVLWGIPK